MYTHTQTHCDTHSFFYDLVNMQVWKGTVHAASLAATVRRMERFLPSV